MGDTPVVLVHGPRQCGKTTLARIVGDVAGVEIKAAATVMEKDFRGLKKLRETTGERFAAGVVMYDGEHVAGFGDNLYAVPIRALWEMN